jgi:hypothetical protein
MTAHIAGSLNPNLDPEARAKPPNICYINWGDLARASGSRSGFRRPAIWDQDEFLSPDPDPVTCVRILRHMKP